MKSPDERFEDLANPHAWLLVAENLHDQAVILHGRRHGGMLRRTDARGAVTGQWPTTNRGALLLGGFAIENVLKGFLVFENPEWISKGRLSSKLKSHSLTRLREMSTLAPYRVRYGWVLEGFERGLMSWARYPCALSVNQSEEERVLGDQLWAAYLRLMVAYVKRLRRLLARGWTGPHGFYGKFKFM
jgi:hypothetical protein